MDQTAQLFSLDGKVALITGAGSGQGRLYAETFAGAGAKVWCADIDLAAAHTVAEAIGGHALHLDVSDPAQAEAAAATVRDTHGHLDVLVNNAGIATRGARTHELSLEDWRRVIDVNLNGVFYVTRAFLPLMLARGGSIISIASIIGLVGLYPGFAMVNSNYAASKAALTGFTKQVAAEYAAENVRANLIAPGWHGGTQIKTKLGMNEEASGQFEAVIAAGVPMQRRGTMQELRGLALFLASDASSYITGQTFVQDGGWTAV